MKTTSSLGELRVEVAKHVPLVLREQGTWIPSHVRLQQKRTFFSLNGKRQKHDELELAQPLLSARCVRQVTVRCREKLLPALGIVY